MKGDSGRRPVTTSDSLQELSTLSFFRSLCLMCVCTCVVYTCVVCVCVHYTTGQRQLAGIGWVSTSMRIDLKFSDLVTRASSSWAISGALPCSLRQVLSLELGTQ